MLASRRNGVRRGVTPTRELLEKEPTEPERNAAHRQGGPGSCHKVLKSRVNVLARPRNVKNRIPALAKGVRKAVEILAEPASDVDVPALFRLDASLDD